MNDFDARWTPHGDLAITIPPETLRALGWAIDQRIEVMAEDAPMEFRVRAIPNSGRYLSVRVRR